MRSRSVRPTEHVDIPSLFCPFAPRDETERWLFELQRRGIRLGLAGIRELLAAMGDPQETVPSIVVAGTNGKGTMSICLAAMFRAAGVCTGLYTSPHLLRVGERIEVDGVPISPADLTRLVAPWRDDIDRIDTTFFESLTALTVRYFVARQVEVAVLEAGLGGRLDATNAVPHRGVVLTSIGLDHQELLGDSLEAIAREKLGLARPGVPFYLPRLPDRLAELARAHLQAVGAELVEVEGLVHESSAASLKATALHGPLQREQGLAAHAIYQDLARRHGWPEVDPATALAGVRAPARYERYGQAPELVVDTAHNAPALTALARHWGEQGARDDRVLVVGLMRDKLVDAALPHLVEAASVIICTAPQWYRAIPPEESAELFRNVAAAAGLAVQIEIGADTIDALHRARKHAAPRGRVLVTGSNFLVAEVLDRLGVDDLRDPPRSDGWERGVFRAPVRAVRA